MSYRGLRRERKDLNLHFSVSAIAPLRERRLTCYPVTPRSQAEKEGFEPTVDLHPRLFSKQLALPIATSPQWVELELNQQPKRTVLQTAAHTNRRADPDR